MTRHTIALSTAVACAFLITAQYGTAANEDPITYEESGEVFPDTLMLDELTVSARKPVVMSKGDRMEYNVQEDASARGKSLIDLLRKVPMVAVDGNDNVTINGQSDFKILVNGQPNPLLNGQNRSTVLKSIPADMFKKIEVITEPGAKYDAEGIGGVLNLITESTAKVNGQTATVKFALDNQHLEASVNALAKRDKVTASLTYGYHRQSPFYEIKQRSHEEREYLDSSTERFAVTDVMMGFRGNSHFGDIQLSYEPDSLNLFTVSVNGYYGDAKSGDTRASTSFLDAERNLRGGYSYTQNFSVHMGQIGTTVAYQHNFGREDHNLITSYQFSHGSQNTDNTNHFFGAEGYFLYTGLPADFRNLTKNPTNEHTVQIDYTLPFGAGHSFETGAKGVFRNNRSTGRFFTPENDDYILDDAMSSTIRQLQDVAAVYASATGIWRNWSLKGGVRYEYTYMAIKNISDPAQSFTAKPLHDVVPNASLTYSISQTSNIHLSYQMRISRPTASQLNPFHDSSYKGPLEISFGNPDLKSDRNHRVALTYSNFAGVWGGNVSLQYGHHNNMIGKYSFLKDDKVYTTYANFGHQQEAELSGYLSCSAVRGLRIGLYGNVKYVSMAFDMLKNHGWGGNFNLNADYSLPWDLNLNAYGGMFISDPGLQSKNGAFHFYGVSLSRDFLKNKALKITLTANNFAEGHTVTKNKSWGDGYRTTSEWKYPMWSAGLSVSYRIGEMSSQVKQTSKSIVNDDLNATGTSSSIGGTGR